MRIAFDMSSVIWTCLLAGKDSEGIDTTFNDKKITVNSAAYGYENAVNKIVSVLKQFRLAPKDMIMVFEGKQSKRRRLGFDSTYKEGKEKAPEMYEQFQLVADKLKATFRHLGATQVTQEFCEADDILSWLAQESEDDLIIVTGDGDLTPLYGVNKYGAKIHTLIGERFNENKYGGFNNKYVPVYKALIGDKGDNIKGCVGFGEAAWLKFYAEYGEDGLEIMLGLLEKGNLDALIEDTENKQAKMIYDQAEQVQKSYRVAKLRPEWVNTVSHPLQWTAGLTLPVSGRPDERLMQWYGHKILITGKDFKQAVTWARPIIDASDFVGLDIETSSVDESALWLLNIQDKKHEYADIDEAVELEAQGKVGGVDVLASRLMGLSITFGRNMEQTVYFPVHHTDTDNCDSELLKEFILSINKPLVIQNAGGFELPVLKQEWGVFLPNAIDTRIESVYVNENLLKHGLKQNSKLYLNYDQVDYKTVTTKVSEDGTGTRQYRMNQLTGQHVLSYACDDTITCSALHNFFKLLMELEHQYQVFLSVETDAMYLGAQSYLDGVPMSRKRLQELATEDQVVYDEAWGTFRKFLVDNEWVGTIPPVYTTLITPKEIKQAYGIVTAQEVPDEDDEEAEPIEDPFLKTKLRLLPKLVALARECGQPLFAEMLIGCVRDDEGAAKFTAYVQSKFKGEPVWKMSPQQKNRVLYEKLGLPIRLRNKLTEKMAIKGIDNGNPKSDALAMSYALKYDLEDKPEIKPVIQSLQNMQVVQTRKGLYYNPYPRLVHWRTGLLHPQIRQTSANTTRDTAADPNVQQMSKNPKLEGETAKVREVVVPHKRNAVVVSLDFDAQELREIAEWSRDENLIACFVGDNLKDPHLLTGLGIAHLQGKYLDMDYEQFKQAYDIESEQPKDQPKPIKQFRTLGKKVNFTTEFGAMAPKLALTMLCLEEEAQTYIDAKEAQFPGARRWKDSVEAFAQEHGYVRTRSGKVRHLADALFSTDRYASSKALRQAVNTEVQGSAAEQTKLARGAVWRSGVLQRFDCRFYFPVHDELVFSVLIDDLHEFLPIVHACMTQPFGKDRLIPVMSSISFGKSFGPADQIEIGLQPTREAIDAGLVKYYKSVA